MRSGAAVCPFCAGRSRPHWDSPAVHACGRCDLRFRHPPPTEASLDILYDTSWADPKAHRSETDGTDAERAQLYLHTVSHRLGLGDFRGLTVLDFGAGAGHLTEALCSGGSRAVAVEPYAYGLLRRRGVDAVRRLEDLSHEVRFDGIFCVEVLEHVPEPWHVLRQLAALLKNTGWMYLSTPNADGLNARIRGSAWREARKAGHLYFFTPKSLEALLRSAGYEVHSRIRFFRYHERRVARGANFALQSLRLDGGLRYLVTRRAAAGASVGQRRGRRP